MGLVLYQGHYYFFFEKIAKILLFFCLIGLLTKRAHFPFYSWLPAAMAAPTPVSALVHSSTLVTAGIFIFIRLGFFFKKAQSFLFINLALITIFLGAINALFNFDRKKVVAYSTLRNLGLMGLSLSLGLIGPAFFHLLAHGVRKALLFICVGKKMIKKSHNQDLRRFSNSFSKKTLKKICGI